MLLERHLNGALTVAVSTCRDDVGVVKTGGQSYVTLNG